MTDRNTSTCPPLRAFLDKLPSSRKSGTGYAARCPGAGPALQKWIAHRGPIRRAMS